jgi:signal transduction histidine kinase
MRLQPVTAGELLEMARRVGSELTQGTDVSFGAEAEPDLPSISADRVQIELVMRNLISNAVDSLAEHETALGTVAVRIGRDGARRLDIVVADNGPGISAAAKASLFRPFISAKPNGMGIGLAVSRAIAEAHGGTLDDESRSHGQFRLVLPVEHTHA